MFTVGRFVEDVPYDPELYFYGEEVTLAVRAFTHGYDLFHPGTHIMWHQNKRRVTPLHWNDHATAAAASQPSARQRDVASQAKVRRMLTQPGFFGRFGLGTARTLAEFEAYAGVSFGRGSFSQAARDGNEPACPPSPAPGPVRDWPVRVALARSALPPEALDRPAFWYVVFHDIDGTEIARLDANRPELYGLLSRPCEQIVLERKVRSARPPVRWTICPTDRRRRWLNGLSGSLDIAAFSHESASPVVL